METPEIEHFSVRWRTVGCLVKEANAQYFWTRIESLNNTEHLHGSFQPPDRAAQIQAGVQVDRQNLLGSSEEETDKSDNRSYRALTDEPDDDQADHTILHLRWVQIQAGVQVDRQNLHGFTALHVAVNPLTSQV